MAEVFDLVRLGAIYGDLSPDARLTLMRIAERLHAGQVRYGKLDLERDTRDWLEERQQEVADELVYGEFHLRKTEGQL